MSDFLDQVGGVAEELERLDLSPVLVGGMALVLLGSRRVTQDFDFVISRKPELLEKLVKVFYDRGLELGSRLDREGNITATIDNAKVAALRLRIDSPGSAYFLNPKSGLRVDLLFDFPLTAAELSRNATRAKIRSRVLSVASERDLMRLKEKAAASRSKPGDAEDLEFLKKRKSQ